jgi:hypothetical protein
MPKELQSKKIQYAKRRQNEVKRKQNRLKKFAKFNGSTTNNKNKSFLLS